MNVNMNIIIFINMSGAEKNNVTDITADQAKWETIFSKFKNTNKKKSKERFRRQPGHIDRNSS